MNWRLLTPLALAVALIAGALSMAAQSGAAREPVPRGPSAWTAL